MSERSFFALVIAGFVLVAYGGVSVRTPAVNADLAETAAVLATESAASPAPSEAEPPSPPAETPRAGDIPADASDGEEGGAGGPDDGTDLVVCNDRCGDGTCQETPCSGDACACAESPLSCPHDCAEVPDLAPPPGA
ncbi:MAG TPA: hypothetical protein VL500_07295 [Candidatus Eisenbacteria bacterium]|nr:hypothetical protein [Candidatus Eisenbacteria bacterium]